MLKNKIAIAVNINLVIYAGVLPWGNAIANIQMGIMISFFLILLLFHPSVLEFNRFKILKHLVFGVYFFICLLSLIYTENLERGFASIFRKLPLVFFPAYVLFISLIRKKWIEKSLNIFSFSVLIAALTSLVLAISNSFNKFGIIDWKWITGANLSESLVSNHKLYFALYIVFAILFLGRVFLSKDFKFNKAWINILGILFLTIFLFLLGARMAIIAVLILAFVSATSMFLLRKKYLKYALFVLGVISLTVLAVSYNPILKERFKEAINYNNEYHIRKQWGGTAVRKLIWKYAFKVVEKNPLIGVGVGDSQKELNESYKNCKESPALRGKNYNSHSEPLQILINTGILGFMVFYGSLGLIIHYQKGKNKLLVMFLFMFLLCGLTESYLERDMGIRVYSFFSVLLFVLMKSNESTPSPQ